MDTRELQARLDKLRATAKAELRRADGDRWEERYWSGYGQALSDLEVILGQLAGEEAGD